MPEPTHQPAAETFDPPVTVSRLFHTLRAYLPVMSLILAMIAIGYLLVAIALYMLAPSQRVTTQSFRLDFEGATDGSYPNGQKFSPAEIVSTPILTAVFQQNELQRFTSFPRFSRSIYILESNAEYEVLAAEYRARLTEPRLTAVDRERIQREFELKRASLAKNDYSINYVRTRSSADIPEPIIRRVLSDILTTWARTAVNEQHVLMYRVAVLSPEIVESSPLEASEPVIAVQILRSKITRLIENIDQIAKLPSAELIRSGGKGEKSLAEIRIRLEELLRFRLDPLMPIARASGISNPAGTARFFETQLQYDQRQLESQQARGEAIRQALLVYSRPRESASTDTAGMPPAQPRSTGSDTQALSPVLSETFIDRLVGLTTEAGDTRYRQELANNYREALLALIPLQQAVSYDRAMIEQFRNAPASGGGDAKAVREEIEATRQEVRDLVTRMNQIHHRISEQNLNAETQLYTSTTPPVTRVERAKSLTTLALYGVLLLLFSVPVVGVGALLHNRMREEDRAEAAASQAFVASAQVDSAG